MTRTATFSAVVIVLWAVTVVGAQEVADAGQESGIFSGTLADSLWTVLAFVILLVVLGRFAWKPLINGLNTRENHIAEQLKSAEDSRVRAEHMLEEYKQQGLTAVREATEQAQRYHQQMVEKTREEALAIRHRANEEIESARTAAMDDLWRRTGDLLLHVGGEVLGRTLTEQDDQRLIDEAVAQIRRNGGLQ